MRPQQLIRLRARQLSASCSTPTRLPQLAAAPSPWRTHYRSASGAAISSLTLLGEEIIRSIKASRNPKRIPSPIQEKLDIFHQPIGKGWASSIA